MEYNKTLNLPKTKFPMKANLPQKELQIQKVWNELKLYDLIQEKNKNKRKFILHDGPPYANGNIHIGHALNKILKDIIVKYKSMSDFSVPFVPGWDCHGLPIEFQLFKKLGISKNEIERVKFRRKAAEYALKFVKVQREEFKRLGIFADWENPYLTIAHSYESGTIRVFKELVKKGYIYRGLKPVYWCLSCETALAEAEVEYMDHSSPSVFVKFALTEESLSLLGKEKFTFLPSVLIWTTTPWTLPANQALCFHPEFDYAVTHCEVSSDKEDVLIVAKDLLPSLMDKIGVKKYKIIKVLKGKELTGIKCRHPFLEKISVGVVDNFVSLEEGTGVVHIAPGHGQEDYAVGLRNNLPIYSPVDEKGKFTKEVELFSGRNVWECNSEIVEKIKELGNLLYTEEIVHSYPHCWRCKNPVIFRSTEQWFMQVDKNNLRHIVFAESGKVNWIPSAGEKRMKAMVENRPDWCLSRQRYWGIPIPVFYCQGCNEPLLSEEAIEKVEQLFGKEGSDSWFIRKPEEILSPEIKCQKCGKKIFRKEEDILDVWFDSAASSEAVLKENDFLSWPADLYLEGSDQHRGWFQVSLLISCALQNKAPFRSVLTHGFVVDGEGKKMSKSLGNVIAPQEIIKDYGADILRLWVSSENYSEDIRLSDEIVSQSVDTYRRIRNTIRYLSANLSDFNVEQKVPYEELEEIDKWALHKLQKLIGDVICGYQEYQFHRVYKLIHNFCAVELSSFYLDVLKDRLYTFSADSGERKSAQTVMFDILLNIVKLLAPVLSHTCEEVWPYLFQKEKSVFLSDFPLENKESENNGLEEKWEKILKVKGIVTRALEKARGAKIVGNSLEAKIEIYTADADWYQFLQENKNVWTTVFIVSQVNFFNREGSSDAYSDGNLLPLKIVVSFALGKKCVRCWNYSECVWEDSSHPQLCQRCLKVVQNMVSNA